MMTLYKTIFSKLQYSKIKLNLLSWLNTSNLHKNKQQPTKYQTHYDASYVLNTTKYLYICKVIC